MHPPLTTLFKIQLKTLHHLQLLQPYDVTLLEGVPCYSDLKSFFSVLQYGMFQQNTVSNTLLKYFV